MTAAPTPATAATAAPVLRGPILAINCGSSSLKYAVFDGDRTVARATVDGVTDQRAAVGDVLARLADDHAANPGTRPVAVGHRLVHGGPDHVLPVRVDAALRARLAELVPLSPLHLPAELSAIDAVAELLGDVPQVVCFDTAFHRTMPEVARRFALPEALWAQGIRRYGFHGLSYQFIVGALPPARLARAVIAHLGSGASMAAIRDGRSVDTTMGFSPAGGLIMATRAGDLDPGLLVYLLEHGHDAARLDHLINREAGLLALSQTTADMRQLVEARATDSRAALAIDAFCYCARKAIGGFAAVLGGIDTLVFTGGIGEHAAAVRQQICLGLDHLGIAIDERANADGAPVVSTGRCEVRVMHTDEEHEIARATRSVLQAAV